MKLIKYTFIFLTVALFSACNQEKKEMGASSTIADIPALIQRGEAIQSGKEWETVQNYYGKNKKALLENKNALEPRLELAQLFVQEARITGEHGHYYPAALKMVEEILALNPTDPSIKFMTLATKASVLLSQHEFTAALATAESAVELNPYNSQVYGALVDAHLELGNYEKAVEMADKMVSIRPDLRSYSRVSYLREIYGQVDGAIEAMEMAVAAGAPGQEQTAWARLTLGNLYQNYKELEQAEMHYQIILQERPNYPFAIAALADIAMKRKDYVKAEELLEQAKAIIPEVGFYEQLAHLYKQTGRTKEMQNIIKEIFVMLEDDVVHGHNMNLEYASIHRDLTGNLEEALKYAQEEYKKRPNNIDVNRLLGSIYTKKNENIEAAKYISRATVTGSKHPDLAELVAYTRK